MPPRGGVGGALRNGARVAAIGSGTGGCHQCPVSDTGQRPRVGREFLIDATPVRRGQARRFAHQQRPATHSAAPSPRQRACAASQSPKPWPGPATGFPWLGIRDGQGRSVLRRPPRAGLRGSRIRTAGGAAADQMPQTAGPGGQPMQTFCFPVSGSHQSGGHRPAQTCLRTVLRLQLPLPAPDRSCKPNRTPLLPEPSGTPNYRP